MFFSSGIGKKRLTPNIISIFYYCHIFTEIGWRAKVTPADSPVAEFEFDVLIGADGKRNTLQGIPKNLS